MKRAIIALSIISSIFYSSESCYYDTESSECSRDEADYENFSCYKMSYDNNDDDDDDDDEICNEFPDNIDSQKAAFKLFKSMEKELSSGLYIDGYPEKEEAQFLEYYPEKESYQKGEEIIIKTRRMSDDDINTFKSKSTCAYQLYGRFLESYHNIGNGEDFNGYVDVENKNSCFNVQQFSDLKDILQCGYAEIKYINRNNKEYNIKTCFYVPTNKMPKDLYSLLIGTYLSEIIVDVIPSMFDMIEDNERNTMEDFERRLDETTSSIEIVAEDKNGKKVKYTSSSSDIEVIEKGKEDEEGKKGRRRSASNIYNISKLNIILFICLILFSF